MVSSTDPSAVERTAASLGLGDVADHAFDGGEMRLLDGVRCRVMAVSHEGYTVVAALPNAEVYLNRNSSLASMVAFNFGVFALVFILVSILVQKVVIDGISATVSALKEHIAAEASHIDADLALARAIQLGNLRTDFPAFPDRREFDLFARMTPAREVGGDFYDLFILDDRRAAVVVADVSSKGIPAAMFMMEAKSCIGTLASSGLPLHEAFERASEKLYANNGLELFVTALMVSIDLRTGSFEYVNAGHNPPAVIGRDGGAALLPTKPGFVLGGMEGMRYRPQTGVLLPSDTLALYTDGVTEALDEAGGFCGDDRLLELVSRFQSAAEQTIVESMEEDVMSFRDTAEQADDITMLAVRYCGKSDANITVRASEDDLGVVLDFLEERDVGGLVIFLTKQLMDGVAYLHEKGKNHLTLRKRK